MSNESEKTNEQDLFETIQDSIQDSLKSEASEWLPEAQTTEGQEAPEAAVAMAAEEPTEEKLEVVAEVSVASEVLAEEAPIQKEQEASIRASTFIADPFGLTALDVRDAQMEEDELDLDEVKTDEQVEAEIEKEIIAETAQAETAQTEESEVQDEAAVEASVSEEAVVEPVTETDEVQAASEEVIANDEPSQEQADTELEEMEEGIPEQDPAQVEQELNALAAAIQKQDEKTQAELEQVSVASGVENPEELLARQIAEDQALEKALAEEDAAETDPELLAALPKQPVEDENGNLDLAEMESCIETLLFMTDKPMSLEKLQGLLGPEISHALFQEAMTSLKKRYQKAHHGIEIVEVAGGFQFRTKVGRAALAKKLAKVQTQRLSAGGMETLAIVAYQQPVLKDDIDKIRGVDSSHFIRGLMEKKLIKISGRSDLPGRPMVYATTSEFLEVFGLNELSELPSLRELEQMIPTSQSGAPGSDEDPRILEMRKMVQGMKSDTSVQLIYDAREDDKFLKDIRERVQSIPTSTPYLDQQKAAEKAAAEAKAAGIEVPAAVVPGLEGLAAQTEAPAPTPESSV